MFYFIFVLNRFSSNRETLKKLIITPSLLIALLFFFCSYSHAAPVKYSGYSWQTTLDNTDRTLTYSFDHVGGYYLDIEGSSDTTVSLDTALDSIVPDWENILKSALDKWSSTADITFIEVPDNQLDLGAEGAAGLFRFSTHPMITGYLGHGFYPMATGLTEEDAGYSFYGDIHFSINIDWDEELFKTTAIHELGHALGLAHTLDPYSIMHPYAGSTLTDDITEHDEANIRALYFPVNDPAPVYTQNLLDYDHDWITLTDGTSDNIVKFTLSGSIDTTGEQKTGIKGEGISLSYKNYGFDWREITVTEQGTITTDGHNAYGIAAGDNNTISMNGNIETSGYSADGIMILGEANQVSTGPESLIVTNGSGGNGVYIGGGSLNSITLNGEIKTTGLGSAGVFGNFDSNDIYLNGSILTDNDLSHGIYLDSNYDVHIELSDQAVISTSGNTAAGIYASGSYHVIINSGTVATYGSQSYGMVIRGGMNRLIHKGTIQTSEENSFGLWVTQSDNLISISGDIITSDSSAIMMGYNMTIDMEVIQSDSSDNLLIIHGSPVISGDIQFGGVDDGAEIIFGASYDPELDLISECPDTDFKYDGNIDGSTWTGSLYAGKTSLNGNISNFSTLTIKPGAVLGGSTHFTGDIVNNGVISPGNSIGTITAGGDYTQNGLLEIEFDRNGSDLLTVSGEADFGEDAGLTAIPLDPITNQQYIFFKADGGITGSMNLNTEDTLFIDFTLSYSETDIILDVNRASSYKDTASDSNLASIAEALDNLIPSASGDLADVILAIDMMGSQSEANHAFSSIMPEEYTALPEISFELTREHMEFTNRNLMHNSGTDQQGWRPYAGLMYLDGKRDESDGFTGFDWKSGGIGLGLDYRSDNIIIGFDVSAFDTETSDSTGLFNSDLESFTIGMYASYQPADWYINGQTGYGHHSGDAFRTVIIKDIKTNLTSPVKSENIFTSIELGFNKPLTQTRIITPFTGIDCVHDRRDRIYEQESSLGVNTGRHSLYSSRIITGIKLSDTRNTKNNSRFNHELKLAWSYLADDSRYNIGGTLENEQFDITGYKLERNRLLAGLDLSVINRGKSLLRLNFTGELDKTSSKYVIRGALYF